MKSLQMFGSPSKTTQNRVKFKKQDSLASDKASISFCTPKLKETLKLHPLKVGKLSHTEMKKLVAKPSDKQIHFDESSTIFE